MSQQVLLLRVLIFPLLILCTVNCEAAVSCSAPQAIGVGANDQIWVLGADQLGTQGNFQPFLWDGKGWGKTDKGFTEIAVFPNGDLVGINSQAEIWRRSHGAWTRLPSAATRIAVGANGKLWMLGTNHVGVNDFQPYFWDGKKWVGIDGGLIDIAVLPNGAPVGVNSAGHVWRRVNNSWTRMPDAAVRIAVAANGRIWVLGRNHVGSSGDYQPYFWDGEKWVGIDGGLIEIAAAPNGSLLGVNSQGQIWRQSSHGWIRMPGAAVGC